MVNTHLLYTPHKGVEKLAELIVIIKAINTIIQSFSIILYYIIIILLLYYYYIILYYYYIIIILLYYKNTLWILHKCTLSIKLRKKTFSQNHSKKLTSTKVEGSLATKNLKNLQVTSKIDKQILEKINFSKNHSNKEKSFQILNKMIKILINKKEYQNNKISRFLKILKKI